MRSSPEYVAAEELKVGDVAYYHHIGPVLVLCANFKYEESEFLTVDVLEQGELREIFCYHREEFGLVKR